MKARFGIQRLAALAVSLAFLCMFAGCPPSEPTGGGGTPDATPEATPNATPEATPAATPETVEAAKPPAGTPTEADPKYKPTLYAKLEDKCANPDGMTLDPETNIIWLNCPNHNIWDAEKKMKPYPAALYAILPGGKVEHQFDFEPMQETGQVGPMGLDIGPDGNLYIADLQYFYDKQHKSRILRVVMENGMPKKDAEGKPIVEVVVEGLDLANAVLWAGDYLYVSDTFFYDDENPEDATNSGIWQFHKDEVVGNTEPLKVAPGITENNPHVVARVEATGVPPRGDSAGVDGMTIDDQGNIYFGNFGDGAFFKMTVDEEGKATVTTIAEPRTFSNCVDGIFYDKPTGLVYINDSEQNAIRTYDPKTGKFDLLWMNDDTDGADGLLDQPCECIVRDGKLIIANFDMSFPGLKNTKNDDVHTLSVIDIGTGAE